MMFLDYSGFWETEWLCVRGNRKTRKGLGFLFSPELHAAKGKWPFAQSVAAVRKKSFKVVDVGIRCVSSVGTSGTRVAWNEVCIGVVRPVASSLAKHPHAAVRYPPARNGFSSTPSRVHRAALELKRTVVAVNCFVRGARTRFVGSN